MFCGTYCSTDELAVKCGVRVSILVLTNRKVFMSFQEALLSADLYPLILGVFIAPIVFAVFSFFYRESVIGGNKKAEAEEFVKDLSS
jgi:hypothetical protein